jgi:hypothetical protein
MPYSSHKVTCNIQFDVVPHLGSDQVHTGIFSVCLFSFVYEATRLYIFHTHSLLFPIGDISNIACS